MTTKKHENTSYWDGLPEHIEVLEEAEAEHSPKPKPKTDYRKKIRTEAARRFAEWKLRKKSPDKPKPTPTPTTPKAPSNTPAKPREDHGEAPQAPAGHSYYWAEPSKGGQHE
jgi:hypothetical protein